MEKEEIKPERKVELTSLEILLTVEDLVNAWKVTPVWVYKLVREKRIPFIHVERCVRFRPSAIKAWLEERENKPCSLGGRSRRRV